MLIDWLTLRFPLVEKDLGSALYSRIRDCMGFVTATDSKGKILWEKHCLDLSVLRSDSPGLFWMITADGDSTRYLTIGASPSSLENKGVNVFGSDDIQYCAKVLIHVAEKALKSILPNFAKWQCRRLDVTGNYDMGSSGQVKEALHQLLSTDAPRRKANSDKRGGDTVYWNPTSDIKMGKAYHKGAHLRMQQRKGNIEIEEKFLKLSDNLLRLELKLGARWFRRLLGRTGAISGEHGWVNIKPVHLDFLHRDFFSKLIGDKRIQVNDMGTLLDELLNVAASPGHAKAAHMTFAVIKCNGYVHTKSIMPAATFYRHTALLRLAGLSSADLCAGRVLEFRQRGLVLESPINDWSDIRMAA